MIWRWEVINNWLIQKNFTPLIGAEIGVKEGRFISHLLANNKHLNMYAIDPWEPQKGGNESYQQWDFKDIYSQYLNNTKDFRKRINEMIEYSADAAKLIGDKSLDFCFIDAQHDYDSVINDISLWLPKVRNGGLLCGHDYNKDKFPGCVKAVDSMFNRVELGENDVWGVWL